VFLLTIQKIGYPILTYTHPSTYIYIHIIIYICINIYIHNYIHNYIYNHWKLDCDRPIDQFQAKCCMFWTLAGYDLRTCLHSDGSQLVFLWFLSWCLVNKEI
jgi:hypothetical protein